MPARLARFSGARVFFADTDRSKDHLNRTLLQEFRSLAEPPRLLRLDRQDQSEDAKGPLLFLAVTRPDIHPTSLAGPTIGWRYLVINRRNACRPKGIDITQWTLVVTRSFGDLLLSQGGGRGQSHGQKNQKKPAHGRTVELWDCGRSHHHRASDASRQAAKKVTRSRAPRESSTLQQASEPFSDGPIGDPMPSERPSQPVPSQREINEMARHSQIRSQTAERQCALTPVAVAAWRRNSKDIARSFHGIQKPDLRQFPGIDH